MKRASSVSSLSSLLLALTAAGCLNVSASSTKASATGPVSADQEGKVRAAPSRIVGYFPDWTHGRRGCEYEVEHIDARLLTHANFAFAKVDPGPDRRRPRFSLAAYDPSDLGPSGQYARFNALKTRNPRLKTLISIGGWTHNEAPTAWVFTTMAASAASRAEFIQSAIEFARQHGFDGIDLDWEYPGEPTRGGRPEDTVNFTALLRELRLAIEAEAERTARSKLLLTIAAPAGAYHFRWLELDEIHEPLDWINLMAYDFAGPWDRRTGVNAPFREVGQGIQGSVSAYMNFGVPAHKIVVGLATYGRSFAGVDRPALDVASEGSGPKLRCTAANGMAAYFEVKALLEAGSYQRHWDEPSGTPFAYDPKARVFISYDDERSITKKLEFVRDEGLGGAMYWSLDTDDYTAGYPLVSLAQRLLE